MAAVLKSKLSLIAFVVFYLVAGLMHFIQPNFYIQVIPDYLGDARLLNQMAGVAEIIIAIAALFKTTRALAGYGTIAMLMVFVIPHVYFIKIGSCAGDLCIPSWVAWLRLIVIHPLLLYWAYTIAKNKTKLL